MALYLGNSEKLKINLDGVVYCLNLSSRLIDGIRLLSYEGLTLKDSNGLYLTIKGEE